MADIVFQYDKMQSAVQEIQGIAAQYQAAAKNFQSSFTEATNAWEGDSKTSMMNFINAPVMEYIGNTIPQFVNALADLLAANIKQMQSADQQISESIPKEL